MPLLPSVGGSDVWGATLNAAVLQLADQADYPPTSANAKDDEFDGTSSVTWTSTPTAPNAWDINSTRPNHAYLEAAGSGVAYVGKYQAIPASYPFTITTKVSSSGRLNYHRLGGIILAPASPTGASSSMYFGASHDTALSGRVGRRLTGTLAGAFSSASTNSWTVHAGIYYVKVTANSATSIDSWVSVDGYAWMPIETGVNPGFTPGVMGLACNEDTGLGGVKAFFDFFRVT